MEKIKVSAAQWHQDGDLPYVRKFETDREVSPCPVCKGELARHGVVETQGGSFLVCPGDWLIKTKKGYVPCPDTIFRETYECCL